MSASLEARALAVLRDADAGRLAVSGPVIERGTDAVYTIDGWRFRVFDDVGDWDYIDAFAEPGGEWVEPEPLGEVFDWQPSRETRNTIWRWAPEGYSPAGYKWSPLP